MRKFRTNCRGGTPCLPLNRTVFNAKIQNERYGRHPVPPGLPAVVFEARSARMHAKGKRQTTQFFINRVVFIFALFSFVNRCAIDPGGTGAPPVLFVPNPRVQNRK